MAATRVRDWPGVLPLPRSSKDAHTHGARRRVEPMIVGVAHRDGQVWRADAGWYARLSKSARLVEPEHPLQCGRVVSRRHWEDILHVVIPQEGRHVRGGRGRG